MTLEEAIKEIQDALADKWCPWSPQLQASMRIALEALKVRKERQERLSPQLRSLLPGETNE